ncbi:MAG: alpha-ketoglutarate-dependent dioxygenase AlkB [Streptomycetales bacterium]
MTGLPWQPSLFSGAEGHADLSFDGLERHALDGRSWVDHVPGWLHSHDVLFELLLREAPWRQRQRQIYDRVVDEPRLVVGYSDLAALPGRLEKIRAVLSARYGVELDSVLVNLYRDGRDSVAWHRDTVRRLMPEPLVATVSLGHRRRFLVRPYGGGPTALRLTPGEGDLVVMGGLCQHEWEHTVPKEPRGAGARMSITLRHSP